LKTSKLFEVIKEVFKMIKEEQVENKEEKEKKNEETDDKAKFISISKITDNILRKLERLN
jgi:hypothetical protein